MRKSRGFAVSGIIVLCGVVVTLAAFVLTAFGAFEMLHAQERTGRKGGIDSKIPYSIAIDGDYAVVGAPWHDGYKGAAYVLRRDGDRWVVQQRLSPADLGRYDHFGGSVAINGDRIIVGAAWHDLFRGAAFAFKRNGDEWVQQQKITASDPVVEGYFGRSVVIDGSAVLVASGTGSGASGLIDVSATYRFTASGDRWVEAEKTTGARAMSEAYTAAGLSEDDAASGSVLSAVESMSGEDQGAPLAPTDAPPALDWVKATGGELVPLESEVKITWQPHVQQDAILYMIRREGILLSYVSSDETQYSDMSAEFDTTYQYCVRVMDMIGGESADSCDTGRRIIREPISMSASDGEFTDKVRVTWVDMSSINTGYSIRRSHVEIGTTGPNETLFDDTTADTDSLYLYEVAATVTGGYQSAAKSDSGWVGVIAPPTNVSASDGQYLDRVRITWEGQAQDTLRGYRIYRDNVLIDSTEANVTTYDDMSVDFGETYMYCVAKKEADIITGFLMEVASPGGPGSDESIWVCDEGGTVLGAPGGVSASD